MEIFHVSKKGEVRKVYSFEEIHAGSCSFIRAKTLPTTYGWISWFVPFIVASYIFFTDDDEL